MYQSIRECNRHTSYVTLASVKPSLFSYIHLRAIINVCFQNNEPDGDRDVKVSPQNVTLRLRPGTIPHTVDKVVTLRGQLIFWFVAEIFLYTDNKRFHIMIHCVRRKVEKMLGNVEYDFWRQPNFFQLRFGRSCTNMQFAAAAVSMDVRSDSRLKCLWILWRNRLLFYSKTVRATRNLISSQSR